MLLREWQEFESFVNSEEYQTTIPLPTPSSAFESFVNSEEYQTEQERKDV